MFIGEYKHSLDTKGRMAVPAKFRADLKKGAVVTKGLDNCLVIYPQQEWEVLASKLAKLPISQANTRAFSRLMLAGAMNLDVDKQGRAVLPEYLRDYAGLQNKVIIAGLYNRLEIWNEKKWIVYRNQTEKASNKIAEQLAELGV